MQFAGKGKFKVPADRYDSEGQAIGNFIKDS